MQPIQGGGTTRALTMIDYLRQSGFKVELLTIGHTEEHQTILAKRVDKLWALNSQLSKKKHCLNNDRNSSHNLSFIMRQRKPELEVYAGEIADKICPDVAIASLVWTARALDKMPAQTLKVLDTHDIQHLRAKIARDAGGDLSNRSCLRDEEINELSRADILVAIQKKEQAILKEMCPDKKVLLAEHSTKHLIKLFAPKPSKDLLFVGNIYDPNIRGVKQFIGKVWPTVKKAIPECRLFICGRVCEAFNEKIEGISFLGVIPDLIPYYKSAAIVINPVPYGSGLSIKTVEALSYGKCLVTTKAGISGIPELDDLSFIITTLDNMALDIIDLLKNSEKRRGFENNAWKFAKKRFSANVVYRELVNALREQ